MGAGKSKKEFRLVRRGYDPEQVDRHLRNHAALRDKTLEDALADVGRLERELEKGRRREEAVHLTLVAATKTKKELLIAAQRELDQSAVQARREADRILGEARREAFRLVTEANAEAAGNIAEARSRAELDAAPGDVREAAEAEAAPIRSEAEHHLTAARTEALAVIAQVKEDTERLVVERTQELARVGAELDKEKEQARRYVARLVEASHQLRSGLRAAGSDEWADLASLPTSITQELASEAPAAPAEISPLPTPKLDEETSARGTNASPSRRQRFFNSQRSARLPRIGTDAASGALAAVSAMRARARAASEYDVEGEQGESELAMQTA